MEEYLEVGQIVNTNGLKGTLKVKPLTDDITRFEDLETIYVQKGKDLVEFNIQDVKYNKNMVLLKLEGIDNIEEAEKYKNLYLKINRQDAVELEDDSYFIVDIIGCEVYTDVGDFLGKVIDVFPNQESLIRLMGAVLLEHNEKTTLDTHRIFYMQEMDKVKEMRPILEQIAKEQQAVLVA